MSFDAVALRKSILNSPDKPLIDWFDLSILEPLLRGTKCSPADLPLNSLRYERLATYLEELGYSREDSLLDTVLKLSPTQLMQAKGIGPGSVGKIIIHIIDIYAAAHHLSTASLNADSPTEEVSTPDAKNTGSLLGSIYLIPEQYRSYPLDAFPFTVRAFSCLRRFRVATLDQLLNMTEFDLRNIRNIGRHADLVLSVLEDVSTGQVVPHEPSPEPVSPDTKSVFTLAPGPVVWNVRNLNGTLSLCCEVDKHTLRHFPITPGLRLTIDPGHQVTVICPPATD